MTLKYQIRLRILSQKNWRDMKYTIKTPEHPLEKGPKDVYA